MIWVYQCIKFGCFILWPEVLLNPLNPRSKFEFSFVAPIHFLQKWWGEVDKISSKFIICDHVRNSHDHSVLQSIDYREKFDADHS